jgi:phosphoribosylaminoimidazole-succinocarboxamide synthase
MGMRLVYEGKTKSVYELESGQYLLHFKDGAEEDEPRLSPGSTFVLGKLKDKGKVALRISRHFFELLGAEGVPSHYIEADLDRNMMAVKKAEKFGAGIEVVCRFRAYGSFLGRYGRYVERLQPLDGLVEINLKDEERGDPLVTDDTLVQIGLLTREEVAEVKRLCRRIAELIRDDLALRGLELVDIRLEFGRIDGGVAIIDDISGYNMRVFREGAQVPVSELAAMLEADVAG